MIIPNQSHINVLTGEPFLSDITDDVANSLIAGVRMPERPLLKLAHEMTHVITLDLPVGRALQFLAFEAIEGRTMLKVLLGAHFDEDVQAVDRSNRFLVASAVLRPIFEGLALFAEYDLEFDWKSESRGCSGRLFDSLRVISGKNTEEELNALLELGRSHPIAKNQKINLLQKRFDLKNYRPDHDYVLGYLMMRNLYSVAAKNEATTTEKFFDYVIAYFFADPCLARGLMKIRGPDKQCNALSRYINQRVSRLLDGLSVTFPKTHPLVPNDIGLTNTGYDRARKYFNKRVREKRLSANDIVCTLSADWGVFFEITDNLDHYQIVVSDECFVLVGSQEQLDQVIDDVMNERWEISGLLDNAFSNFRIFKRMARLSNRYDRFGSSIQTIDMICDGEWRAVRQIWMDNDFLAHLSKGEIDPYGEVSLLMRRDGATIIQFEGRMPGVIEGEDSWAVYISPDGVMSDRPLETVPYQNHAERMASELRLVSQSVLEEGLREHLNRFKHALMRKLVASSGRKGHYETGWNIFGDGTKDAVVKQALRASPALLKLELEDKDLMSRDPLVPAFVAEALAPFSSSPSK